MSQYLPTGNFKWMTDKEISKIDLGKYKADGKKGLILEVDLEYPRELHDMQSVNSENSSLFEFVSSEKSESFSSKTSIVALASQSADSIFRYEHSSTPDSGFSIFVSLYLF